MIVPIMLLGSVVYQLRSEGGISLCLFMETDLRLSVAR